MGFTGKEGDDEVGLVYFGERYLIARVARWASADPLHVHASGGGEALNSYHYVSGNLLAARDPLGLDVEWDVDDRGDHVEMVGHVELVVFTGESAEADRDLQRTMESQAAFWNSQQHSVTLADGRTGLVRFHVTVSVATAEQQASIQERLGTAQEEELNDWARGEGVNLVVRIDGSMTSHVSPHGSVAFMGRGYREDRERMTPEGRARSWNGAHEIGHLIGLGDRYYGPRDSPSVADSGYTANIMGGYRNLLDDSGYGATRRIELRSEQVQALARAAMFAHYAGASGRGDRARIGTPRDGHYIGNEGEIQHDDGTRSGGAGSQYSIRSFRAAPGHGAARTWGACQSWF